MKSEKIAPVLLSAILAFLLSLGAVGCLITGFRLEPKDFRQLVLLWAGASALFSLLFSRRWGTALAACLLALAAGYLWHRGTPLEQTRNLLVYISKFYHGAYQWGYFLFGDGTGPFDYPLAVLGSLIAMANAHALVGQRSVILPLTLASLLLAAFLLILLPQRLRREDPVQGCRLTLLAALPVMLALAALFTLYPKEDYVNLSKELQSRMMTLIEELPQKARDQAANLSSGLPSDSEESLDLKRLGPRPNYSYEVMTVTVPESGIFYLRGRDYDAYTGTGWTASPHRAENFGGEGQTVGTAPQIEVVRTAVKSALVGEVDNAYSDGVQPRFDFVAGDLVGAGNPPRAGVTVPCRPDRTTVEIGFIPIVDRTEVQDHILSGEFLRNVDLSAEPDDCGAVDAQFVKTDGHFGIFPEVFSGDFFLVKILCRLKLFCVISEKSVFPRHLFRGADLLQFCVMK